MKYKNELIEQQYVSKKIMKKFILFLFTLTFCFNLISYAGNKIALLIGVSKYQDSKVPEIHTDTDISLLKDALKYKISLN